MTDAKTLGFANADHKTSKNLQKCNKNTNSAIDLESKAYLTQKGKKTRTRTMR